MDRKLLKWLIDVYEAISVSYCSKTLFEYNGFEFTVSGNPNKTDTVQIEIKKVNQ